MTLPWGVSPAFSAHLQKVNQEMDAIDQRVALEEDDRRRRELNEMIYLKAIRNFWLRQSEPR